MPSPLPPGLPVLPQGPPVLGTAPAPVLVPRPDVIYLQGGPPPQEPLPAPWRFAQPPGWFVVLEASPALPHIETNHRHDNWGTDLNWTVVPTGTIGYLFNHGGSLLLSYRNLTSQVNLTDPADSLSQRIRLNANWLDLTYLSRLYAPGPHLRLQWESGLRGAYLYSDVSNQWPGAAATVRDTFGGAGPHLGGKLAWWFGDTGLSLFTRLDVGVLFGQTRERAATFYPNMSGTIIPWAGSRADNRSVVDGRFELGLGYVVPTCPWLRFDAGWQAEAFSWQDLTFSDNGPFLRMVIGF
jgi:hypothetical protein